MAAASTEGEGLLLPPTASKTSQQRENPLLSNPSQGRRRGSSVKSKPRERERVKRQRPPNQTEREREAERSGGRAKPRGRKRLNEAASRSKESKVHGVEVSSPKILSSPSYGFSSLFTYILFFILVFISF